MRFDLTATCTFGLEAVVKRELAALGYDAKPSSTGRVEFTGDAAAIARCNLWLRSADRVLIRVGRFEAMDFEQLFEQTRALPWQEWIAADAAFPVNGRSVKSQLSSVPAVQRTVKKAIVEKLRDGHGVGTLPETEAAVPVEIALLDNVATLTLDTTGVGLHKRGYRDLSGAAPLRETLAAALVQLSFWNPDRPLIDPFCGSGTICIEAAMLGRNLAPGRQRNFTAEHWPWLSGGKAGGDRGKPDDDGSGGSDGKTIWQVARDEARDLMKPALGERIIGTDIHDEALSLARRHAQRAGVADDIHLQQRAFDQLAAKRTHGCLITNPPYGVRLNEEREVQDLYASMPLVLRRLPTWSFFILTSYPGFEQCLGREADRRRKLYNAQLQCTYYQFHGPRPGDADSLWQAPAHRDDEASSDGRSSEGQERVSASSSGGGESPANIEHGIAPPRTAITTTEPRATPKPVFGGVDAKAKQQAEVFANRLRKMDRHRRRWPTKRGITCYRVYNREVPEVPLMVDRYEDCLLIGEYFRPHDRDVAQQADWLDLMVKTASEVLGVTRERTYFKARRRQKGLTQYEKLSDEHATFIANEAGLRFEVNLSDYLDTGLFLDHRITRNMIREQATGKRVLNLFAYTGSFSVYAAAGGAKRVTTVDLSNTYLDWAKRNFELNDLSPAKHGFIRSDAMGFVEGRNPHLPNDERYDLAIVDPPTFSNSKSTEGDWDVQTQHANLLNALAKRMAPGGVIYFSNNFHRFKLDEEALVGFEIREITKQTVPEDFANKKSHRCWLICPDAHVQ